MIKNASAAVIAILALCAFAWAGETPSKIDGPRYSFYKSGDGFLRLDTQTGEVALCSVQPVGWACLTAPEDRVVLDDEIARLRNENAALKRELLAHNLRLPSSSAAEPAANGHGNEITLRLPDDADIQRMVALVGHIWHQLVEAITNAQSQVMHKG